MWAHRICLLSLLSVPFCSGCVLVSMHSTRPVEVRVTQKDTGIPLTNLPVKIRYSYTGYGAIWVLRMPEPTSAQTDVDGVAVLPMADFFQNISFTVDDERFALNK